MADYTTTGLLAGIRRRAMLPSAASTGTADADLLALANEELVLRVAASILSVREEYFVTYTDTAISGTEYRIPSRAIGQTLRDVKLRDSSGREAHLTRLRPEQAAMYSGSGSEPVGYYLRGSYLALVPSASTSFTTLRMFFAMRPSELTATATDFDTVEDFDSETSAIIVADDTKFSIGDLVDVVSSEPGFDVKAADLEITTIINGALVFANNTLPAGIAVGDYVCQAGKSPVPTIPVEFHPVLEQRAAIAVANALGDTECVQRLIRELVDMEQQAGMTILSPRTEGSPQKVVARASALNPNGRRYVTGTR